MVSIQSVQVPARDWRFLSACPHVVDIVIERGKIRVCIIASQLLLS